MENKPSNKKTPTKKDWVASVFILIIFFLLLNTIASKMKPNNKEISSYSKKTEQISETKQKENSEAILKEGQILNKYNYTLGRKAGEKRFTAIFNPFLPRNDTILMSAMYKLINQAFGENIVDNQEPRLVSRDGVNLIMLESTNGNYLFMLFKENTGEVNGLVFWKEEAGGSTTGTNFEASVRFTGTQFIITNLSNIDCVSADMAVNSGFISGGYILEGYTLKAGQTYTVGALQFTKGEKRLNPMEIKPKDFYLYCRGSNTLDGASWYGSFE